MEQIQHPLTVLNGIGEKKLKPFRRLGVETCEALLRIFPRTYLDYTHPTDIADLPEEEQAVVRVRVETSVKTAILPRKMTKYTFTVADDTGSLRIVLFNQKYTAEKIKTGLTLLLYGKRKGKEMTSPLIEFDPTVTVQPVYPLTDGLTQYTLRKTIRQAFALCGNQTDPLPEDFRKRYDLPDLRTALQKIHFPDTVEDTERARYRFLFEELFFFTCGVRMIRGKVQKLNAPPIRQRTDMTPFIKKLPYRFTNAQIRVIREIFADMARPTPMSRLLQGDVGSGKTVVAAAMCYHAVQNGGQCCMMAPTEILALQHLETVREMLEPLGVTVACLTGSTKTAERREILQQTKDGTLQVLIGTHALIQKQVEFQNLVLAINDEQHRFGVQQRATLAQKGNNPHMLFMSATPIPRTLALVIYGDLDISVLDEMPPGRTPVQTHLLHPRDRKKLYEYIAAQSRATEQTYIICPLVEDSESMQAKAVTVWAEELRQTWLNGIPLGIVHGKMSAAEKETTLRAFATNEIRVLIATTVVEVGINVPNATTIVIENAERFGLSQLHQLRGRVGRGKKAARCFLVSSAQNEATLERMKAFCATTDGFEISKKDLELRGPGDFFGNMQHGLPPLKLADLMRDTEILQTVTQAADDLLRDKTRLTDPAYAAMLREIQAMFKPYMA